MRQGKQGKKIGNVEENEEKLKSEGENEEQILKIKKGKQKSLPK